MRDDKFSTNAGIVNFHTKERSYRLSYVDKNHFDSYDCAPTEKSPELLKSKHGD